MKPFVVLALPGMYLFYKYNQYKRQQREQNKRKVTEQELAYLNHKIDKLLTKLDENEPELATSQEDECVICVNAKATMQTAPCGHRVVCRKCFVKTIQMAVSQRLLPLRCVICRAKILRLKQTGPGSGSSSLIMPSTSGYSLARHWVPSSASDYSISASSVPNSDSFYSVTSGSSSLSGVSSVSCATNCSYSGCSCNSGKSGKMCNIKQPTGSFRKSQAQAMKYRLQDYKEPLRLERHNSDKSTSRLPPIKEFQRDFKAGKERPTSTRIRCAQKIVTQLERTPSKSRQGSDKSSTSSKLASSSFSSSSSSSSARIHRSDSVASRERSRSAAANNDNKKYPTNYHHTLSPCSSSSKPDKSSNDITTCSKSRFINSIQNSQSDVTNKVSGDDDVSAVRRVDSSCNPTISSSSNSNIISKHFPSKIGNKESVSVEKCKEEKKESAKVEKKELTKSEKKELKKEAKAEKKNAKKEAKLLKKEQK